MVPWTLKLIVEISSMVSSKIFSKTMPPAIAGMPPNIAAYQGIFSDIFNLNDKSKFKLSNSPFWFFKTSPTHLSDASSVSKTIGYSINALFLPTIILPEALLIFTISSDASSRPSTIAFKFNILRALKKVDSGISLSRFKSLIRKSKLPS